MDSNRSQFDYKRLHLLATALAAGDSLGSTSEFTAQGEVPDLYKEYAPRGWPFAQCGGGTLGWHPGQPTDDTDMAMCLLRSFKHRGVFDPEDLAARFVQWLDSNPSDIGFTTSTVLLALKRGTPWHQTGKDLYTAKPRLEANGSLMRNGVVPGMSTDLDECWRISLLQGCITHYAPQPVLCCAAQVDLIHRWLSGESVDFRLWPRDFISRWRSWINSSADPHVRAWLHETRVHLDLSIDEFQLVSFGPDLFNPFEIEIDGRDGHCLLTLQIGVWAAAWALRGEPIAAPPGFPPAVFEQAVGPRFIAAAVMIGHDADTYGATAGPMIAAATGEVPDTLLEGLDVRGEIDMLFGSG